MKLREAACGIVVGFVLFSSLLVSGIIAAPAQAALTPAWQAEDDMPSPRTQAGMATGLDGKVYIFGGAKAIDDVSHEYEVTIDESWAFDPETGAYAVLADMPYGSRACVAMAGDDGLIYVFGGYNDSWSTMARTQIYDPEADSWTQGTPMPYAESFITGAKGSDGRMYVMGGSTLMGRVQIYDPVAESWSAGATMPYARFSGSAVVLDEGYYILYLGGTGSWSTAASECMVYYTEYNYWDTITSLPSARVAGTAVASPDGLVYFMGGGNTAYNTGGTLAGQEFYSEVFCYSPYNDTWFEAVDLPYSARYGMSTVTGDGLIWFFGGNSNTVIYDRVSTLEVMRVTVTLSSSTVVQGGSVLVYVDPQFAYLEVMEYDIRVVLEAPSGYLYSPTSVYMPGESPFAFEVNVPSVAETGLHTIVVDFFVAYTPGWWSVELPMEDMPLTVLAAVSLEDQLAALQADMDALNASQADEIAELAEEIADLKQQLAAQDEDMGTLEDKADSANLWAMLTMVLVVVVLVLLVLMFLMGRKKA